MRILVTNDDGVRAPGIAALARMAAATGHEVVVVAPMVDYSGAGAAVGPVHSRDGVDYETYEIDGLDGVPTYGIDGPPALAVILACVGGFGPRPDLVLSGINHGVNVGRSALHSGTVGAALTAAHFGLRCLAVSIRWGSDPVPWDTPATLAGGLIPVLAGAPAGDDAQPERPQRGPGRPAGAAPRAVVAGRDHPVRRPRHRRRPGPPPRLAATGAVGDPPPRSGPARGTARWSSPTPTPGSWPGTTPPSPRWSGSARPGAEADDTLGRALDALYAPPRGGTGARPGGGPRKPTGRRRLEQNPRSQPECPGRPEPASSRAAPVARRGWLAKACTSGKVFATRTIGWWSPCGSSGGCRPGPDRPAPVDHRDRLVGDWRVRAPVTSCSHPTRDPP